MKQLDNYLLIFSKIFSYPKVNWIKDVESFREVLKNEGSDLFIEIDDFYNEVKDKTLMELQENYTKTFDLSALACLDVGFVLFGEDYKRGAFLVEMQKLQRESEVDCGSELPDHLVNVLKLLSKIKDLETRLELIEKIVLPMMTKTQQILNSTKNINYYRHLPNALINLLKVDYQMKDTVLQGAQI